MNNKNSNELSNKISALYDMELNNYLMERGIESLNKSINRLGIKKCYAEPRKQTVSVNTSDNLVCGCVVGAIIGAILIGLLRLFTGELFSDLIASVVWLFWGGVGGAAIGTFCAAVYNVRERQIGEEKSRKKYEHDVAVWKNSRNKDSARVQKELVYKEQLSKQRNSLSQKYEESKKRLEIFYENVGIDKKYRNLISMGYMNEFLSLHITDKLEGADGLYYLIRKELKFEVLNVTLKEISNKLDSIIDQESQLYSVLTGINNKCDRLVTNTQNSIALSIRNNELSEQTARNTEIAAYNTERSAKELEYQSMLTLL